MKKIEGIRMAHRSSASLAARRLKYSLSAAVIASAMMAGNTVNAADLTVDGSDPNPAVQKVTINPDSPLSVDTVYVLNGGEIVGAGTLTASVKFDLSDGEISVNLAGDVALDKITSGNILLTGSNSYTGATNVNDGNLQIGDGVTGSINSVSDVYIGIDGRLGLNLANGSTFANNVEIAEVGGNFGNFVVESSGTTTISGVISGGGGFYVWDGGTGTGHVILTGSNTSTGDYGVESGTLQIGDGTSGSIDASATVYTHVDTRLILNLANNGVFANDVDNDGYFVLDTDGVNTVSGVISGGGAIGHEGTGLTILTGANTLLGSVIANSGTLQIGDGVTAGASIASADLVAANAGATLAVKLADGESFTNEIKTYYGTVESIVDSGVTNTFTNRIAGTGGFTKNGEGTVVFTNAWDNDPALDTQHEYYGATKINAGTLRTDADWALSERSAVEIASGATLDLNGYDQEVAMVSGSGTLHTGWSNAEFYVGGDFYNQGLPDLSGSFFGEIRGDADIYKGGKGVWALFGDSSDFEGTVYVDEGLLAHYGTLGSVSAGEGDIRVGTDGALMGNGLVGDDVRVGGRFYLLSDFNTPSTFTVGDDYEQYASGTLIAPVASSKKYGVLDVYEEAELDGKLVLLPVKGYKAKRSDKLTILKAGQGVSGRFAKFKSLLPETMLTAKVVYKSNSVVIEFEQEKFASLKGLTENEKAVARALDKSNTKSSLNDLFDKLNYLSIDEVPDTLALLSPEQYAAIYNIGFASSQVQFNNLERRLSDVRNGATGFSSNGLALTNSRGTLNYNGAPIVNERDGLSLAGFDGKSIVGKQTVAPIVTESRWSFFVTGQGEWADVESTSNALGSEFSTGGVSIGADYRVSDNFVVGLSANYTNTGSDLNDGGKISVNSGRGAVYASVFGSGFYGNAVVGGGYNSYDLKRATFGGKANGDTDGGQFDALLGGGYDYKIGGFTVGPVASVQYTYLGINGFDESGSDAPLSFKSQHQESLKTTLGLKASYAFDFGGVRITPEVRAQWLHEYLDSTAAIESSFTSGGSAFTVNGPNIGRDGILFDAGLSAQFSESFSVFAYYTGDYGRTNYTSNSVNGGFRFSF